MKLLTLLIASILATSFALTANATKEKPTQHLKVADVESMAQAKKIFVDSTAQIQSKKTLTPDAASEIHIITYSLEKSVEYFANNLTGVKQGLAKDIAVVVEDIHIASENNRLKDLEEHLQKYTTLVDKFLPLDNAVK